ncbi:syndecan [Oratosquilla oratoria]|uniref:syndecan n=1 Tax=Oratosquilla oratoria TaxID=337810 RepID=UPI003F7686D5
MPDTTTPPPTLIDEENGMDNTIQIQMTKDEDRHVSIFAQPGILAAFIGGAVVGLLCAILLVMFIVYRMRKKDEGSYPLDEQKRMPLTSSYSPNDKEIYA